MTTAFTPSATTPPTPADPDYAPGCKTCAGRSAQRLDSVGAHEKRALARADAAAAALGDGVHVHHSRSDDRYVVVRPDDRAETEVGQP
ncbi:hypothetical protein FE633_13255 [Streptomyces montanus]|uniref:DUF2188 domain-containing protein n=1 Tax=Streptomyces montanus TaxID=2580423 RepID=A0A5R9FSV0_9ACTN|nr:hypothetical protein [Streptomyces montanus]TLS45729.1 hypothetical protein FE633_13255 [Streptomyces montanus]